MIAVLGGVLDVVGAVGYGAGSAVLPLLNAEVFAVAAPARSGLLLALVLVVALAAGQTAGKLVLFEAARRGSSRLTTGWGARFCAKHEGGKAAKWAARIRQGLSCRRTAVPLVFAAATLGLPPMAAVSLAAGTSSQRRWEFGVVCLVGRTLRFGVLALPAIYAVR